MTDQPNRRPAEQQPTTGNEPSLSRLWAQLEAMRHAEEIEAAEQEEIARLQTMIEALQSQIASLEAQVQEYTGSARFERTGFVYDVRPREHDRAHPEIVKHSVCSICGSAFSYQIYATGWTRTICEDCRPAHRRAYQRAYQQRRRAEQRRMDLDNPPAEPGE